MKTYQKIYLLLKEKEDYISGEDMAQELGISRTSIWKAIRQLETLGLTIEAARNRGYKLAEGDLLLPELIAQELNLPVHLNRSSDSTQLDAKQGIELGHSSPALYLAPHQNKAKGRFGRPFYASKSGGIYMSLRLSPNVPFLAFKPYTILAAAAVVKAIQSLCDLDVQIKWVNDIYLGRKKVAGILTEAISSMESQTVTDVIIGVGINVHIDDFPKELHHTAGNLFEEQPPFTRNQLIIAIWKAFLETDEHELITLYKEKSLVVGQQVSFVENQIEFKGRAIAVTDTGNLVIQLENGKAKTISSGEISLTSWTASQPVE
ncbi:bifunctional biotin--[acetyl-CoA-carboxylase] ligase/biotin operon repressor BirA [Streptococcus suis]|uniref:bifunctional biotin--[acetyl-CoA-carboxylase] ligase/biotin operon repressor BirA n=1 Tax=Streptococcus parasuis TaxID=1501662 RepID=UPI000424C548|nr:bifunctional biotin--[acetyl-CoA-carboxylase] ligase/biotin operon repressor BirA [Streptococcus parasuis]MDG4515071.1 bifunctional biotin--[acetyl-CoA-carboxylase] ligase/biotin operon repressor BirA [Streptococcus suis]MDG4478989.1 bifunctional biotin--[acetyl-CoA-carboxylase] ligase/biotin operon repressor BirA [Streptococcus parasuis]NQM29473.1 bifunctional biotin--[acetyl-CoA-carboxylase] synthetase/biotin operon repressor [Streptococcus suis]NQM55233.1 bifunctional biotin--[acetyl-CoA-